MVENRIQNRCQSGPKSMKNSMSKSGVDIEQKYVEKVMSIQSLRCHKPMFYRGKTYIREKYGSCNNSRAHVQKCIRKHVKIVEKLTRKRIQK